jgi:hypothetical protein
VFIPLYGPPNTDLTQYPVVIAIVDEDAGEPATGAYTAGVWTWKDIRAGRATAALLVSSGTYPNGDYMAYAKLTASDGEAPVVQSGRIRIGDGVSPAGTPGAPSATWVTSVNGQAGTVVLPAGAALAFGASILVDAADVTDLEVTLTGAATLQNPSGLTDWQIIRFHVTQGTGAPWTLAYGSMYDFGADGPPQLSVTPGAVDIVAFQFDPTLNALCCSGWKLRFGG